MSLTKVLISLIIVSITPFTLYSDISAQLPVQDSTIEYCTRFTNLNAFQEYIFFYDGILDWNKRQITSYDCVSFVINSEPKLYALDRDEYIKGDLQANLENPQAILIDYVFSHPGVSEENDSTSTTDTSSETTIEDVIEFNPAYRGLNIRDSVEVSYNQEDDSFNTKPISSTYKKKDGTGKSETIQFGALGERPKPTLNDINYLPYIIVGIVTVVFIGIVAVYFGKNRIQSKLGKLIPRRSNFVRTQKKVGPKRHRK